jgi:hypothetical protein
VADETKDAPKGFESTASGVETNEVVGSKEDLPKQTPDQFYDPAVEAEKNAVAPPKNHATKGMTSLGWSEASRIENTAAQQEADRKAAEKAAAKED